MRLVRNLRLSLRALAVHRLRTGLAVCGTAIGIGGVVVLTALGEGARRSITAQFDELGTNVLIVTPAQLDVRAGRQRQSDGSAVTLTIADAAALRRASPRIRRTAPAQYRGMIAKRGPIQHPTTVFATTPEWLAIRQFPLEDGRFFTNAENAARARVAVLGADARTSLFADTVDPVGRGIRLGSQTFAIIGTLAERGASADGSASDDDRIYVPVETGLHRMFGVDHVRMIFVQVDAATVLDSVGTDAAALLRARHDLAAGVADDFVVQNPRVLLAARLALQASFRRLLGALGLLSLTVAVVGIMSVMLLAVRERRAEIGVRIAVGARRLDVLSQFLAEALALALVGGALGTAAGTTAVAGLAAFTAWDAHASSAMLAAAGGAALLVGVASGVLPAWRAASLHPVDALRDD